MAYISRQSLINKTVLENPDSIIIMERCVYTDRNVFAKMLYNDGKIDEINYQIYNKWFDEFAGNINYAGHIYVSVTPQTCAKRIAQRDRQGETIPLEYLKECDKHHKMWLYNNKASLIIDSENETNNDVHCKTIHDFIIEKANEKAQ